MPLIDTLDDLRWLRESVDLECKLAGGRDGQGAVPEDFWKTYSAFANTHGGVVVLGMRERRGEFVPEGVPAPDKVRKDLFNTLNNPGKVSVNLLTDDSVQELVIDDKTVLIVEIPRAPRASRPVYLNGQVLKNTWRRLHDGDRLATEEWVKRQLAEQTEDSRDARVLAGYDLDDLTPETLRDYRRIFTSLKPTHPQNALDDRAFLRWLGGYATDRDSGRQGLTGAGLLMFGREECILQAFPHFMVDYRERPDATSSARWVDRIIPDGTWSGNLFDFYRKVYPKLVADLKIPFTLVGDTRRDDTAVHVALREALVNTLIHADYAGRASILVVKRPDLFGFRNPGLMRIPAADAYAGVSDCRNRNLAKMFSQVGLGERAGSGMPRILQGWREQHWRMPALTERTEPFDQTLLELHMVDLLSPSLLESLRTRFPGEFDRLTYADRLIVATAATENTATHERLKEVTGLDPIELSRHLQRLVAAHFLICDNPGRASVYHLAGDKFLKPEDIFADRPAPSSALLEASSTHLTESSTHLTESSTHLTESSTHLTESSTHLTPSSAPSPGAPRDTEGRLLHDELSAPFIDRLDALSPELLAKLQALAQPAVQKKKLPGETLRLVILEICRDHYLTLACLAALLRRDEKSLRQSHLKPLVDSGRLRLAFPTVPTDPRQAYHSAE